MERSRSDISRKEKGPASNPKILTYHSHIHNFREVHLDVDQSTTRTLGTNSEDTTSAYGKMRAMFVKTLVHHHPNTQSLNADASIAPELLSGLKVSGHINNFLWLRKSLLLTLIFTMSVSFMFLLFMSLPKLHHGATRERWKVGKDNFQILNTGKEAGREDGGGVDSSQQLELVLKLPKNITELRAVRETLLIYQKEHQQQVQINIIFLYIFLQAFMIPGSIFLNILAGSLYGFYEALILVLVLATVGSALCYTLSCTILKEIVYHYFPERCEWFAHEVHHHRHNLLSYILFLRITPILPNWFINVSAPIVSVPLRHFVLGTFLGLIPASVVAVKAGRILSQINSLADLYDHQTILTISVIAILVLLPVIFKRQIEQQPDPILTKTT
ncbi:hypothetical protein BDL97_09G031300 [Sphagnum fallax]|nr:hypothetical protein BDL97_09G031300 [Sphagnum fallax]